MTASLEHFAHCRNIVSLSLFCLCYFGTYSCEVAELVPFPYSCGRPACYSSRMSDFLIIIPRCYKDATANSFFPRSSRPCSSLLIECFLLTYCLNGFVSRLNSLLLSLINFYTAFLCTVLSLSSSFSCNCTLCSGFSALCVVNPNFSYL